MNNIIKIRKEIGYSLFELAETIGISVGYMSHLEKGNRKNPSYHIMKKIALKLNRSIEEIFDDNEEQNLLEK